MLNLNKIFIVFFLLFYSCNKNETLFNQLNEKETGIDFTNNLSNTPEFNILKYLYFYNGAGVSVGDFNNDGLIDVYFTSNQKDDKLYINLGGFKFKDVTTQAGINNSKGWTTGVATVDINNDGLLDIYVCKTASIFDDKTDSNLLFVNQGNKNGKPFFKEESKKYGLDFKGYSTQAVFFDYDLDSDLDMFLLNHSVHPNRNYGNGRKRNGVDSLSGDKLYENKNGIFHNVSNQSGIFQGTIGYGLGVSVSDVNNDGYPDIYVGNDFFENDYLYINQKDKTFKEIISADKSKLGHTTHFSMGNAVNDLNNDGLMDIISLDMLPEDIKTYKTSGLEYPYQTYESYLKYGYSPQFMQNTFHVNAGNGNFNEVGYLSGIAATEWSWSPLVADFDNDGEKDIYITNGILGATNDMDFISFISNEEIQKKLDGKLTEDELALINKIPEKKIQNYFFKNNGNNTFDDYSKKWLDNNTSFSNGAGYADFDNDGDLDIVVNNVNETAFILENTLVKDSIKNTYLKVKFKGAKNNPNGIGAKVYAFKDNKVNANENYTTRGYLSSVEPKVYIGLGETTRIDSLQVIWPNGAYQTIKNVAINQEITVAIENAKGNYYKLPINKTNSCLLNIPSLFNFKHKDNSSIEFNRDPLVPYASTNLGSSVSVADINNDGLEDVFVCGGKKQSSQLLLQINESEFQSVQEELFLVDEISEDISSAFFDANGDGFKDLLVVSGGNEFKRGKPIQPRLYFNENGSFVKDTTQFDNIEINASKVKAVDIDNDSDLDIVITSNLLPWQFGITPKQYIFENDGKGNFTNVSTMFGEEFQNIGNVQDIVWVDLNNDKLLDAIAVGYWMPVSVFINDGKKLHLQTKSNIENTNGWWNSVKVADFDKDGDLDIVAGNWGLNTRLKASYEEPITLYSNDFDDNGTIDPIVTYFYQNQETTFSSKDELVKQIPLLNKKYLSYQNFANAKFNDLLPSDKIKSAYKKHVYELASCYFENLGNNTFKKHQLPLMTQVSTVNDMFVDDFNNDSFLDILLVGNNYEISTHLGKLDASHGSLLLNDKEGFFHEIENQQFDISGPARNIEKIEINDNIYFIVSRNNDTPIFLKKSK
ncbi:VCBS repeat-containing protein [Flaviramulus sp. BrNp1-15]|uniref:VCBS repeat-containing protein n=1 Tax=Flaviramulus sp. BrNp1-15 TaxID=2916754 RepID=UPI001EE85AF6|nr:VCBS repeat-containing protein [Flaviramulus sp. BrNp1-15]ULC59060.1 VCBS repeat-containing protein [Flaviramulus sp. BrNp1-15]